MVKKDLKLVRISEKYVKFLSKVEPKVPYNLKNKKGRPFIGILFTVGISLYFAPLSSPKKKHQHMPNNIDFLKIDNGKSGVINFNNMIPVPKEEISIIDINKIEDPKYSMLIVKQLHWSMNNNKKIKKHAKNLRKRSIDGTLPFNIKNRCCNFLLLEKQLEKYLEKEKQKNFDISL